MDWWLLVFLLCMIVVATCLGVALSELWHLNRKGGGVPPAVKHDKVKPYVDDEGWRTFRLPRGRR